MTLIYKTFFCLFAGFPSLLPLLSNLLVLDSGEQWHAAFGWRAGDERDEASAPEQRPHEGVVELAPVMVDRPCRAHQEQPETGGATYAHAVLEVGLGPVRDQRFKEGLRAGWVGKSARFPGEVPRRNQESDQWLSQ